MVAHSGVERPNPRSQNASHWHRAGLFSLPASIEEVKRQHGPDRDTGEGH